MLGIISFSVTLGVIQLVDEYLSCDPESLECNYSFENHVTAVLAGTFAGVVTNALVTDAP